MSQEISQKTTTITVSVSGDDKGPLLLQYRNTPSSLYYYGRLP